MVPAGRNVQSRRAPGSLAASRPALSSVPVFQPLPVFVGLRYVRTRRQGFFVSFISWISMAGVGLGVAALITILSVMNGFEGELRSRLVSLTAHATVTGSPQQLAGWRHTARRLAAIDGVVGVAPFVDVQAMAGRAGALEPVLLHGVDAAAEPGVSTIEQHLLQGRLDALRPGSRAMIVGRVLAWQIGAEVGDELTVLEEVGDGYDFVELPDGKIHVRSFLRMLAFPDSVADTRVGQLSGGERNRVQLARLLRRGGNLLVLDEPTNDLDLPTLGALEEGLIEFPGCALIVSHDRWFLDRVATAILAFEGAGKVTLYEGSYSFYAERRPKPVAAKRQGDDRPKETRPPPAKPAGPRKLTFKEKQELAGIEAAISTAEARVVELEATLSDPSVFKDRGTEVQGMVAALDAARAEVERLFARWQELDAIAAAAPP